MIPYEKIKIIANPNSYIHALIKFNSGMIKIIAHQTSMIIPIYNTIYGNEKNFKNKNWFWKLNKLNFQNLNTKVSIVKILNYLPNKSSLFETIIVSANDEYVKLFYKKLTNDISKKLINFATKSSLINIRNYT